METENTSRVQRMVNKRYKRDLLLLFMATIGVMITAVLAATFLKPHLQMLDDVEPEIPTACSILLLIVFAILKYARK